MKPQADHSIEQNVKPDTQQTRRLLRLISACSRILIRIQDEQSLLQTLCRLLVKWGGYPLAWIGYQQDLGIAQRIASAGDRDNALLTLPLPWIDSALTALSPNAPAPIAKPAYRPYLVQDLQTEAQTAGSDYRWQSVAQRQYAALVVLPIVLQGNLWGGLYLCTDQTDAFPSEIMDWLRGFTLDLSHRLQSLRAEKQQQQAQSDLTSQIAFDRLVARLATRFTQCSNDRIKIAIDQTLQEIGEFSQVDTSYIFRYSESQPIHSMIYEWVAEGCRSNRSKAQDLPLAMFPWATDLLQRGETVYITHIDHLPPEAAIDRQSLQHFGIQATLAIPLCIHDRLIGLMGFASFQGESFWSEDNIRLLKLLADILSNALQQQQIATDLQTSEQRYAHLAEAVPVGIFRANLEGQVFYANDRWCQIVGLNAAAQMDWFTKLHPDDADRVWQSWQTAVTAGQAFQQEYRFQHPDGRVIWVLGQAVPEVHSPGPIRSYIGTLTDISAAKHQSIEQQQVEAALRDSEARFRSFMEYSPTIAWITDAEGWIDYISPTYRQVFPLPDEVVGKHVLDFHPPELAQTYLDNIRTVARTGQVLETVERGIRLDGSLGEFLVFKFPLPYPSGRTNIGGVAIDITDRKQAEADLQRSYERYNNLVNRIPIGVYKFCVKPTGEQSFEYVSSHWSELNQLDPDAVLQDASIAYAVVHPEERDLFLQRHQQAIATATRFVWEGRMVIGSEVRWMHVESSATRRENGEVVWDGIQYDVTDRIQAEQERERLLAEAIAVRSDMTAARDLLTSVFERMNDAIVALDTAWCYIYVNDKAGDLLGKPAAELVGQHIWTAFPEGIGQPFYHACQRAVAQQQVMYIEEYYAPWDRWFENRIYPDANGLTIYFTETTDRKRAEAAAQASESRYASLAEAAPVGIFRTDLASNCLYANDRWCQMAGVSLEQAMGLVGVAALHPQDRDWVLAEWHRAVAAHLPFQQEYRFQHGDGQVIWVFGQAVPERDGQGQVIGYVGTTTDISDRKRAELALQQRDQRIDSILSTIAGIVWSWDPTTRELLYLSPTVERISGYTATTLLSDPDQWFAIIHPGDRSRVATELSSLSAGSTVLEYRIITASGQIRWLQNNCQFVDNPADLPCRIDGIAIDITNLKTIQASLSVSEERLRLALQAANQGLYDLNLQTGAVVVSPEYATMLGYDPATFQESNAHWIERLHPDDRLHSVQSFEDYLAGRRSDYQLEFRQRTQSGQYIWILSAGKIVDRDEQGQPLRMLGIHTDITDRKRAEEQAQHRLDILEAARDIIGSVNSTGQLIYLNQAGRELLGIQSGEAISQTAIPDYHPAESAEQILQDAIPQSIEQGFWAGETRCRRCDGSEFPAWQTIVPHRRQDGSISYFSTIIRDITDLKQAEAERLRTEKLQLEFKLLETILEVILGGYWDTDFQTGQEYLSPGFKQMFGYEDHELPNLPETWQHMIFAEDLPGVTDCFNQHVQSHGQTPFYNEVRYRHKNGSTIWVICSGQVVEWDEQGNPLRMVGCHIDITALKQAEAALRESEALIRSIFDSSADCIKVLDLEGNLISINLPGQYLLEMDDINQIIGQCWLNFWQESDRDRVQAALHKARDKGIGQFQGHFTTPKGTLRWWDVLITPIIDLQGNVKRLVATSRDITDRKQSELAIAAYAREVEDLYNHAPCGYHSLDPDGRYIRVNETELRWLGYSREEMIGQPLIQFFTPASRQAFLRNYPVFLNQGWVSNLEYDMVCKDGSILPVMISATSVKDAAGNYLYNRATLVDIRDRKQAEAIWRLNEERLQLALEGSGDGLWDWNITTSELYLSPRWLEMLGYQIGELPPQVNSWNQLIHPDDQEQVQQILQAHLADSTVPYAFEYRLQHRSGTWRWIANYGKVAARDTDGQPLRMVGIHRDIHARKQAETQLQQVNADLQRSNQELEQFAYIASHDLQEPLRAITGYTQLLAQQYGPLLSEPDAQQYLGFVIEGAQRMRSLIQDLLVYSRVGSRPLKLSRTDCQDVLADALDNLYAAITESAATITVDPLPTLWVDRTQLTQVFQNLISNAIKFHHTEPPQIRITATELPQEALWRFAVQDNGIGIKPQYLDRIFDIFRRLHSHRRFPGTGIGLALCKKSIERHGGKIWAESQPNVGTTFYFTLPIYTQTP